MKTPSPKKRFTCLDRIVTISALFYVLGVGIFIHLDDKNKEERQALRYKAIEMAYMVGKIVTQIEREGAPIEYCSLIDDTSNLVSVSKIETIDSPHSYRLTSKGVNRMLTLKGVMNWHYELSRIATHQWVIDIRETPSMEMALEYLPFLDNDFSAVANKKRFLEKNRLYQTGTNVWHLNACDLFTTVAE